MGACVSSAQVAASMDPNRDLNTPMNQDIQSPNLQLRLSEVNHGLVQELVSLKTHLNSFLSDKSKRTDVEDGAKIIIKHESTFPKLWLAAMKQESRKLKVYWGDIIEACFESLEHCLESIGSLAIYGFFEEAVLMANFTSKIMVCIYFASQLSDFSTALTKRPMENIRSAWISGLGDMKGRLKQSALVSNSNLPIGTLHHFLSTIELGIYAVPDPTLMKTLIASGAQLAIDITFSSLKVTPDPNIVKDVFKLAKSSALMVKQRAARAVYHSIATLQFQRFQLSQDLRSDISKEPQVLKSLLELERQVQKDRRWEVSAAYADLLGGILLDYAGEDNHTQHSETFMVKILLGDPQVQFGGLLALASLGDPANVRKTLRGKDLVQVAMRNWSMDVSAALQGEGLSDYVLMLGMDIIREDLHSLAENLKSENPSLLAQSLERSKSAFVNLFLPVKMMSLTIERIRKMLDEGHQLSDEHEPDKNFTDLKEEGLKMVGYVWKVGQGIKSIKDTAESVRRKCKSFQRDIDASSHNVKAVYCVLNTAAEFYFGSYTMELIDHITKVTKQIEHLGNDLIQVSKDNLQSDLKQIFDAQDRSIPFAQRQHNFKIFVIPKYFPSQDLVDNFLARCNSLRSLFKSARELSLKIQNLDEVVPFEDEIAAITSLQTISTNLHHVFETLSSLETQDKEYKSEKISLEHIEEGKKLCNAEFTKLDKHRRDELFKLVQALTQKFNNDDISEFSTLPPNIDEFKQGYTKNLLELSSSKQKKSLEFILAMEKLAGRTHVITQLLDDMSAQLASMIHSSESIVHFLNEIPVDDYKSEWAKIMDLIEAPRTKPTKIVAALGHPTFLTLGSSPKGLLEADSSTESSSQSSSELSGIELSIRDLVPEIHLRKYCELLDEFAAGLQDHDLNLGHLDPNDLSKLLNENSNLSARIDGMKSSVMDLMTQQIDRISQGSLAVSAVRDFAAEMLESEPDALNVSLEAATAVLSAANPFGPSRRDVWRVREHALYNVLSVHVALRETAGQADTRERPGTVQRSKVRILDAIQEICLQRKLYETESAVKCVFHTVNFMARVQTLVKEGLVTKAEKIEKEIQERLKIMDEANESFLAEKDPEKKQIALIALRREQAALNAVMANVSDISKNFKFLASLALQMESQLLAIDSKLNLLAQDVSEMRSDV